MTDELGITALTKITKICTDHNSCLERADIKYDIFHGSNGSFSVFSYMDVMLSGKGKSGKHFRDIVLLEIKAQGFIVEMEDIVGKGLSYTATLRLK